jgi:hypothetical protein
MSTPGIDSLHRNASVDRRQKSVLTNRRMINKTSKSILDKGGITMSNMYVLEKQPFTPIKKITSYKKTINSNEIMKIMAGFKIKVNIQEESEVSERPDMNK